MQRGRGGGGENTADSVSKMSAVCINEIELDYHRPHFMWVSNNGDQTLNTMIVPVHVLV